MKSVALVNVSGDADVGLALPNIARVLTRQGEDFAAMWQRQGVPVIVADSLPAVMADPEITPITAYLDAPAAGELGDHEYDGRPIGRVFWGPLKVDGGTLTQGAVSLSATCSHEYLEILGNPYGVLWVDMPWGDQEAHELCDRTEGDSYPIQGVTVSNFLGPRAFRDGPGPFDWMGLLTVPWEIRPNGYVIRRRSSGEIYELYGAKRLTGPLKTPVHGRVLGPKRTTPFSAQHALAREAAEKAARG